MLKTGSSTGPKYEKEYLSPREVADKYGVNIKTVYDHIHKGTIQAIRVFGNTLRIPRSSLEERPPWLP